MQIPKRILIVRTDRIGDVILSTPVIKNLRNFYPSAHIAFMCRPYTKDIAEGNPYLDEVIVYDKDGKHKSIWKSIGFASYLRKKKFDLAIILHPTDRMHTLLFFCGIAQRVGWNKKKGWLLTQAIPHTKQEGSKHELEYTLDILRAMNIPVVDKDMYFPIKEEAEQKIEKILKENKIEDREEFIVIHPSASCPSKRWPQEYFSKLVRLLKEKAGVKIAIITSKDEKSFGEQIVKENEVVDLRGNLSVAEIGSLLKRAKLFISNDSGPVHIAAALGIPVISIFGRNDFGLSPKRWKPLGEKSIYIHKPPFECPICLAHNCTKGFLCLKAIKPEDVFEKALILLNTPV
ncbi:MAG: lipopolysaccharide heptosyltransferase II [Candidatus Omnitrophota bacterium]|nr:lipopolysaccharide heptosyltransferase II [Candidatus Omnitrophota bacterium]